jgi:internalin A
MNYEEALAKIKQAALDGAKELKLERIESETLPPEIGQLINLQSLNLSVGDVGKGGLRSLPPEIGNLTNLLRLDLSDNQITHLPPELGRLANLDTLLLGRNNNLTRLPLEIGELTNLTYLTLQSNKLTELPSEFGNLTNLEKLTLGDNNLTILPREFGSLAKLRELDLHLNKLTELPEELSRLTQLKVLDLRGNPLPIPPEILNKKDDPAAILNYYFSHRAGQKKPLNEAKVLVLGQGSVGKTSLVRRLVDDKFDPRENKTEGIDIRQWQVDVGGDDIRLNVWDFGGQEIMHATHQFFLTKRSLYVLVLDARLGEEENRVEYWLKIIESFGGDSPIILVGNKVDQQPLDIDRRGLQLKYRNIKAVVETSCEIGRGLEELKSVITREIGALDHIHDQLLVNWFAVKTRLERMEQDFIPYHEYVSLCRSENIDDELSQRTLMRFMHDLGIVLNFQDDPRLEDTNILKPEWVTNGVYKILNSHELFKKKGVLERRALDRILDPRQYPKEKHLFIMDMMRKFELCFDFEGFAGEKFLIPDLLSKEEPYTGDWPGALAFQYHYNVLPASIISRFIVRMHPYIHRNTSWRTGVVLEYEGNKALVKADIEDKKVFIRINGPERTRRAFLAIIRNHFDSIHKSIPGIAADEKVPLPRRPEVVVDYKHLLNLEALGEESLIPEGLTERVNVKQLLDGLETEQARRERQESRKMPEGLARLPPPALETPAQDEDDALAELTRIKDRLDLSSERYAKGRMWMSLGVLLAVWAVLAFLTYKLGWNQIEPWTYFFGLPAAAATYVYFAVTRRELSPTVIYEQMVESKKRQTYLDSGFDLEKYKRLTRSKP